MYSKIETYLSTEFASCCMILARHFYSFRTLFHLPTFPCCRSGCAVWCFEYIAVSGFLASLSRALKSSLLLLRLWLWHVFGMSFLPRLSLTISRTPQTCCVSELLLMIQGLIIIWRKGWLRSSGMLTDEKELLVFPVETIRHVVVWSMHSADLP